jgi:hypothetical protein
MILCTSLKLMRERLRLIRKPSKPRKKFRGSLDSQFLNHRRN